MAVRMRLDPPVPMSPTDPSCSTQTVGDIMVARRVPAGQLWNPSGKRSASPISLFMVMPVSPRV